MILAELQETQRVLSAKKTISKVFLLVLIADHSVDWLLLRALMPYCATMAIAVFGSVMAAQYISWET